MGQPPGGPLPAGVPLLPRIVRASGSQIGLLTEGSLPPQARYIPPGQNLLVRIINSLATTRVAVLITELIPTGEVITTRQDFTPTSDRLVNDRTILLTEGWLLSIQVFTFGSEPLRGQTWVSVRVLDGTVEAGGEQIQTLINDYVEAGGSLTWPGNIISHFTKPPGVIRSITGTDPAAGSQIQETVPANTLWRIISIFFSLTTVLAGAQIRVDFRDAADNVFYRAGPEQNQGVGSTIRYSLGGQHGFFSGAGETFFTGLPVNLYLTDSFDFITSQLAAFPADANFTAPQFLVEEWIQL